MNDSRITYTTLMPEERKEEQLQEFLDALGKSYPEYHGEEYHRNRIAAYRCLLFTARDNATGKLTSGCYVKPNGRRCATFVAKEARSSGLAMGIVRFSLQVIRSQYSILAAANTSMIGALLHTGFSQVKDEATAKNIAKDEAAQLDFSDFREPSYLLSRYSARRANLTRKLVLLQAGFKL